MADSGSDYQVGPGRPPLHTRFKKAQSGDPGSRSAKSLPALLADARNERTLVTIDGRRRTITKREAIVTQMVDKSASAGGSARATKMLIDMMKGLERKAGVAAPPLELRRLSGKTKRSFSCSERGYGGGSSCGRSSKGSPPIRARRALHEKAF
jgi:hypothetical protein